MDWNGAVKGHWSVHTDRKNSGEIICQNPVKNRPKTSIKLLKPTWYGLSSKNIYSELPSSWGVLRAYLQEQFLPCGALLAGELFKDPKMGNHGRDLRMKKLNKILQTSCVFFFFQGHINLQHIYLLQSNMTIIYGKSYDIIHLSSTYVLSNIYFSHPKNKKTSANRLGRHFGVLSRCFSFSWAHGLQLRGRGASWVRWALELHDDENWVFFSGW